MVLLSGVWLVFLVPGMGLDLCGGYEVMSW